MHLDSQGLSRLRQLFHSSNAFKATLESEQDIIPSSTVSTSISAVDYELPPPVSISRKLTRLGLAPAVAEKLSLRYLTRSEELRLASQKSLHGACSELARIPLHSTLVPLPRLLETLIAAHTDSYFNALGRLEEAAYGLVARLESQNEPEIIQVQRLQNASEKNSQFNHDFTSFLQKYFEHNAYPSSADREVMAKKSAMKPRQIEVWFQNHRRRARQEGQVVRRLRAGDPAPLDLCLAFLNEQMPKAYLVPDGLRQSMNTDVSEAVFNQEDGDDEPDEHLEPLDLSYALKPRAARHAYPLTLAKSRTMPSFIRQTQEFAFPPPGWPHKPSPAPSLRPAVSLDECVASFARTHVRDSRPIASPPFQIPTTVIPPRAPLPALVRREFIPTPIRSTGTLNAIPAPRARFRQHPFRSPSSYSQPATLLPLSGRRQRKPASGLHRSPKRNARVDYRDSNLRTSEAAFPAPSSRTPSLESLSSISPLSSFGSSGSSSGPPTPT